MRRSGHLEPGRRHAAWRDSVVGCAVGGRARLELSLVPWRAVARHCLLEMVVEEFVRIVLGGIRWQIVEFDLTGMILDPGADAVRSMDRQVVDDDEQLARRYCT